MPESRQHPTRDQLVTICRAATQFLHAVDNYREVLEGQPRGQDPIACLSTFLWAGTELESALNPEMHPLDSQQRLSGLSNVFNWPRATTVATALEIIAVSSGKILTVMGWHFEKAGGGVLIQSSDKTDHWPLIDERTTESLARGIMRLSRLLRADAEGDSSESERISDGNSSVKKQRHVSTDALFLELISNNHEAKGWTAKKVANEIGRGKSAVAETKTWKELSNLRETIKIEKQADRHRRRDEIESDKKRSEAAADR